MIQIEKSYLDAEFMLSREGIDPRQAILISQELVLITMFSDSSVILIKIVRLKRPYSIICKIRKRINCMLY